MIKVQLPTLLPVGIHTHSSLQDSSWKSLSCWWLASQLCPWPWSHLEAEIIPTPFLFSIFFTFFCMQAINLFKNGHISLQVCSYLTTLLRPYLAVLFSSPLAPPPQLMHMHRHTHPTTYWEKIPCCSNRSTAFLFRPASLSRLGFPSQVPQFPTCPLNRNTLGASFPGHSSSRSSQMIPPTTICYQQTALLLGTHLDLFPQTSPPFQKTMFSDLLGTDWHCHVHGHLNLRERSSKSGPVLSLPFPSTGVTVILESLLHNTVFGI